MQSSSQIVTTNKPTFHCLQALCPSVAQPTVSKHWRKLITSWHSSRIYITYISHITSEVIVCLPWGRHACCCECSPASQSILYSVTHTHTNTHTNTHIHIHRDKQAVCVATQYASTPWKMTISSHLFARWHQFRHPSGAYNCQMPGHKLSRLPKGTPSESRLSMGTIGLG